MRIAIRMDDITPDMDWKKFGEFKALLDEYQVKPLIGVVPDNRDRNLNKDKKREDFWLRVGEWQKSGWVIAQHGYRHVYTQKSGGCFPLNHFSEFAGLKPEEQKRMLSEGKRLLASHGIETDIFMAPAHSYDKHTLQALRELGMTKLTDGFGRRPYRYRGITFYPISFHLGSSLKRKNGTTTMVIHTNTMNEGDMKRYRRIFETQEMISYTEYLEMQPVRRGLFGHIGEYMLASFKRIMVKM